MRGTTHKIGGISAGLITLSLVGNFSIETVLIATTAGIVGSLVPDIDEPNSIVGKKVKLLSRPVKAIFGHRGIIHTPIFLLGLAYLLSFLRAYIPGEYEWMFNLAFWCFIAGYVSHLLLDMFTPQGIMLFFPLSSLRVRIIGIGDYRDLLASALIIVGTIIYFGMKFDILSVNLPM